MNQAMIGEMLAQNQVSCSFALNRVSEKNAGWRVNESAASIGFIYRHVGETMHLFGQFFGAPTDVRNTTMGAADTGQDFDVGESRELIQRGYTLLEQLAETTPEAAWLDRIETPFFGPVTRARLFSHVLFHTAHHAGQIALTLSRPGTKNH